MTAAPGTLLTWLHGWLVRRARQRLGRHGPVPAPPRRLYVDVSVLRNHDSRTGIQRVVRAVAAQLAGPGAGGWDVHFVAATRKRGYRRIAWPGDAEPAAEAMPLDVRPGDVFLGLDFALDAVRRHARQLASFRKAGAQVWFVVYDLLPVQRPDWFSDKLVARYRPWLRTIAALGDGYYCISQQVQDDLRAVFAATFQVRDGFRTQVLRLGSDLQASRPSRGLPAGFDQVLQRMASRPTALVVGTIEPRKGHADLLAAFEWLWQQGRDHDLVFVGQGGWKTEQLQQRLLAHPEAGGRMRWIADASDEALEQLYAACHGVIVASHAEGFGLPLVEALAHRKPVLARSLPVFLLHAGSGVQYFPVEAAAATIAGHIEAWFLGAPSAGPLATGLPTWADTARDILRPLADTFRPQVRPDSVAPLQDPLFESPR